MTARVKFFALAGLVTSVALGAPDKETKPLPPDKIVEFQQCTRDADCVYARNGCCDCANGGEETAVNKAKLADFQQLFDCKRVGCLEKAAVPPCGSGAVSCAAALCVYTKPPAVTAAVSITTPDPYPAGNERFPVVWTQTINHPGAQWIVVHFAQFFLPPGDSLTLYSSKSVALASFSGRGPEDGVEFWGPTVPGESVKLVLRAGPRKEEAAQGGQKFGVLVDSYTVLPAPASK